MASAQPRKGGRFIKKTELERREKAKESVVEINARRKVRPEPETCSNVVGRRIVDLSLLAELLWCFDCEKPLSLRDIEKEKSFGIASVLVVKCRECLDFVKVPTSSHVVDSTGRYPLYAVNCKAALGCLNSGVGPDNLNTLLTTMNIPPLSLPAFKRAQDRVGEALKLSCQESCERALIEEKALTTAAKRNERDESEDSEEQPDRPDPLQFGEHPVACNFSFDQAWQRRGNGREFNSQTGHGSAIGVQSKKVCGIHVMTMACSLCRIGRKPEDHVCNKNYEGSSKGMEPATAVKILVQNPMFEKHNVILGALVGDEDSSVMAAVQRQATHRIVKLSDVNHVKKGVSKKLYNILNSRKYPGFTSQHLTALKRYFSYAVSKNTGNVEGMQRAIKNIPQHAFGFHEECGDWCSFAQDKENHRHKNLPGGKPLHGEGLKAALTEIFTQVSGIADRMAHGWSSQGNESFNHIVCSKTPKAKHYGGTEALQYRVCTAVLQKNEGALGIIDVNNKLLMSPGGITEKYMLKKQQERQRHKELKQSVKYKRRRLQLTQKRKSKTTSNENREGITYFSDMGLSCDTNVEPLPADAIPVRGCVFVVVDLETTGLDGAADILQISAKCGEKEFDKYMLPLRNISPEAAAITKMEMIAGELCWNGNPVDTTPPQTVAQEFVAFLKSVGPQVVLVGHNIKNFDAPRILRFLQRHQMAAEFGKQVWGISDTLTLLGKGKKVKRQQVLAEEILGAEWAQKLANAHNALVDVQVLHEMVIKKQHTIHDLVANGLTLRAFMEGKKASMELAAKKKSLGTLPGVTQYMVGKIAAAGITREALQEAARNDQEEGVRRLLKESVNGKVRVTSKEDIITAVYNAIANST